MLRTWLDSKCLENTPTALPSSVYTHNIIIWSHYMISRRISFVTCGKVVFPWHYILCCICGFWCRGPRQFSIFHRISVGLHRFHFASPTAAWSNYNSFGQLFWFNRIKYAFLIAALMIVAGARGYRIFFVKYTYYCMHDSSQKGTTKKRNEKL